MWGGSFFFSEVALGELGPFTVVLGRVGIAAVALVAFVYLSGRRMPGAPGLWGAFLVMGALNNLIPFSLIVWGQVTIDSGLASILNATTPLFAVTLAHLLTRDERMTPSRALGVLLGLGGVAVLVGPGVLGALGAQGLAQVAVLGAAFSYACAGIYGRRFKGLPPAVAAAGMVTCSAVLTLPLALVVERPWEASPGALTWAAVLGPHAPEHRARLPDLLPHLGRGRGHQPAPGHLPHPGQRAAARYLRARRAPGCRRLRRHGPDLRRPGRGRRPAIRAPAQRRR